MSVFEKSRAVFLVLLTAAAPVCAEPPDHVDITWMSISNVYYDFGMLQVLTDGYISRLPPEAFSGGGGGLANTSQAFTPDVPAVKKVLDALGGAGAVDLLLNGHSHFDHSFDIATWSTLSGAPIIGSKTTCFQAIAEDVPAERCTAVYGDERFTLAEGVVMHVVRWNHSGDPAINPEQHNPVELDAVPTPDAVTGGLRAGVAEDFPNGGGNRAFLFVVDSQQGRFSWFFQNSASEVDLQEPIIVDGVNYGAPLDNLKRALEAEGLIGVDLWIGTRGLAVAQLVVPVLKPKAFLPVHWDGLWGAFEAGVIQSYAAAEMDAFFLAEGVAVIRPQQYMDAWRLDINGVSPIPNARVKRALGFEK